MKTMMKQLTSLEEFENIYNEKGTHVFVFSADWCPDCMFIKPFLPRLIDKYKEYDFIYVDYNKFEALAQRWNIMGIPSFVVVEDGKETRRFVSKLRKSEKEIDDFLKGVA